MLDKSEEDEEIYVGGKRGTYAPFRVCLYRRHPVKVHSKVTGQESEWQEKDCDKSKEEKFLVSVQGLVHNLQTTKRKARNSIRQFLHALTLK